MMSRISVCD